jgi:tetratricopeptide (TPR) repeat protein
MAQARVLAAVGETEQAITLIEELGPAAFADANFFEETADAIRAAGGDSALLAFVERAASKETEGWTARLRFATELIARQEFERADAALKGLQNLPDGNLPAEPRQTPTPIAAGVMGPRNLSPVMQRLAKRESLTYPMVQWVAQGINQAPVRGLLGTGTYPRRNPRAGRQYGSTPLAAIKTPEDVRVAALVLRAQIAIERQQEQEFIEEWRASATARGLGGEERLIELMTIQSPSEAAAEVARVASSPDSSDAECELAFYALLRLNWAKLDLPLDLKAIRDQLASRLVEADPERSFSVDVQQINLLMAEDRREKAAEVLGKMISRIELDDPNALLQTLGLCINLQEFDRALELYGNALAKAPSLSASNPRLYGAILQAGWQLGFKMLSQKPYREKGLDLIAGALSEIYGKQSADGARRQTLGISGRFISRPGAGGSYVRLLNPTNLANLTPLPNAWFDEHQTMLVRQVHGQAKQAGALDGVRKRLAAQVERFDRDRAIHPRLALIYFDWWDGERDVAIEAVRELQRGRPGEDFSDVLAPMLAVQKKYGEATATLDQAPPAAREKTIERAMLGLSIASLSKDEATAREIAERVNRLYPKSEERAFAASLLQRMNLQESAKLLQGGRSQTQQGVAPMQARLQELAEKEDGRDRSIALARSILRSGIPPLDGNYRDGTRQSALNVLRRHKAIDSFLSEVEEEMRKQPASVRLRALAAEAAGARNQKDAVPHLEELCRLQPENAALRRRLMSAYLTAERPDEAIKVCDGLLANDPVQTLSQSAGDLIQAYKAAGRLEEFASRIREAMMLSKGRIATYSIAPQFFEIGQQLASEGAEDAALDMYRMAVNNDLSAGNVHGVQLYIAALRKHPNHEEELRRLAERVLFPGARIARQFYSLGQMSGGCGNRGRRGRRIHRAGIRTWNWKFCVRLRTRRNSPDLPNGSASAGRSVQRIRGQR